MCRLQSPNLLFLALIYIDDQYIETDLIPLAEDESFDPIQFWQERYYTQMDLARMALDALAVPAMSDECERLFRSAKILLNDRRSRLKIDIIEASEYLRAWYGPPTRKTFDDENVGLMEEEPTAAQDEDTRDTRDRDDAVENSEVEDEPQILDLDEGDAAGSDQDIGAASEGESDLYSL